jgi:hypothetical protein
LGWSGGDGCLASAKLDCFSRPAARSRSRNTPSLSMGRTLVSRNSLTCPHETAPFRPRLRQSRRRFVRERNCAVRASAGFAREAVPRERALIPASVPVAVRQTQLRFPQGCSWAHSLQYHVVRLVRGILNCCQNVVAFKIGIVLQNFLVRRSGAEEFDQADSGRRQHPRAEDFVFGERFKRGIGARADGQCVSQRVEHLGTGQFLAGFPCPPAKPPRGAESFAVELIQNFLFHLMAPGSPCLPAVGRECSRLPGRPPPPGKRAKMAQPVCQVGTVRGNRLDTRGGHSSSLVDP